MLIATAPTPSPPPLLVEIVGSGASAPWWGVPFIAGGFLIIGALLGFWFNRIQDKRKAQREDIRKWDDRILELTTEVIANVDTFNRVAIASGRESDGWTMLLRDGVVADDEGSTHLREIHSFAQVGAAFIQMTKACTSLELIAPSKVREAAEKMRNFDLSAHPASGYAAMAPIVAKLDDKRRDLERTVREHFGIK